jgi:hypothetical protein
MSVYLQNRLNEAGITVDDKLFPFLRIAVPDIGYSIVPLDQLPSDVRDTYDRLRSGLYDVVCRTQKYEWGWNFVLSHDIFPAAALFDGEYYGLFFHDVNDSSGFYGSCYDFLSIHTCYRLFKEQGGKSRDEWKPFEEDVPMNHNLLYVNYLKKNI